MAGIFPPASCAAPSRPAPRPPGRLGGLGDRQGAASEGWNPGPAPHDPRGTWVGDLLAFADLATVQRMAGQAAVATIVRYDRRDHAVQRKAAAQLHVRYVPPDD